MKTFHLLAGICFTLILASCALYEVNHVATTPSHQPIPLTLPAGKQWQIVEEPPILSNDQGTLPFQMEQSVQPEGAAPVKPALRHSTEITDK
jgi:hypothetical protein